MAACAVCIVALAQVTAGNVLVNASKVLVPVSTTSLTILIKPEHNVAVAESALAPDVFCVSVLDALDVTVSPFTTFSITVFKCPYAATVTAW